MANTYAKSRRGFWYPVSVPESGILDLGEDWRDPVTNETATGIAFAENCPENPPEPEAVVLNRSTVPTASPEATEVVRTTGNTPDPQEGQETP